MGRYRIVKDGKTLAVVVADSQNDAWHFAADGVRRYYGIESFEAVEVAEGAALFRFPLTTKPQADSLWTRGGGRGWGDFGDTRPNVRGYFPPRIHAGTNDRNPPK